MPAAPATASAAVPVARPNDSHDDSMVTRVARSLVTGFGVASFVKGLFGGGDNSPAALPRLPKFSLPARVAEDVAYSSQAGGYLAFDRSAAGGLRVNESVTPAPITINVQAMDSKSFLEHSHEIARAVREAMLNSHALNDVVSEL
jgi:hypothetical protein